MADSALFKTNAREASARIGREFDAISRRVVGSLRDSTITTFKEMVASSPYLTGNYRANMQAALNNKPGMRRITGARAGLPGEYRGYRGRNRAKLAIVRAYYQTVINTNMHQLYAMWNNENLKNLKRIIIFNDAAHAHLVENGGPINKAYYVFARGTGFAENNFKGIVL